MATHLTRIIQCSNRYQKAVADKQKARLALAEAVTDARREGYSLERIGQLLGVGPQAVSNMVRKGR